MAACCRTLFTDNTQDALLVCGQLGAGEAFAQLLWQWLTIMTVGRLQLLVNYGIVEDDNPYDKLQLTATIPHSDPLFQVPV